ncbi:PP2C family protein-serine/threonine phosphatase [Streptomyces sp. FXJ1.172]|uniref:PP2C family protein-serine/threonine phosphatase n=1 Tax=Streptomyces sp. FXJ1.172 TaxID=710705 RepID=UPI000B173CE6|nr:PP2C family protein-serine/threonine phosphatase [Streptomyces sp. FXJ1.172]WEO93631.1 PP2C family protein-serine/threonine phosphatase [Streptomyces sp. FXJ1.172]
MSRIRTSREPERGGTGPQIRLPAPPAWLRWLPALYVAGVLALEPLTPVQWPVSFVLIGVPLVTAFAHGPVATACATAFAVGLEAVLAGTPCCAGRSAGYLWERHYIASYICTALVGALGTILAAHRVRRERTLADVRFVAEMAQRVLLRPVPHRIGRLLLESLYLSAAAEARIGGDLFEVVPTGFGVRLLIGDVRGKGLLAVETAATLLGAFRETAYEEPDLTVLAARMETSMSRRAAQLGGRETVERFVTAVFAEIPDDAEVVRVVNCGHPPPICLRAGQVLELDNGRSAPPLNLSMLVEDPYHLDSYPFLPGDQLLLYTDGVTETRDAAGTFYPLVQRLRSWGPLSPKELLARLHDDLLAYSHQGLQDDTAALAVCLLPGGPPGPAPAPGSAE